MEDFIRRVHDILDEKDMSQRELASLSGVTEVTISRYLSGERTPRLEIVKKMADVLNVSIDYLLGRTDIKNIYEEDKEKDVTIPIAAHFKGKEMTEEQRKRIEKFIEFTLNEDD